MRIKSERRKVQEPMNPVFLLTVESRNADDLITATHDDSFIVFILRSSTVRFSRESFSDEKDLSRYE